MTVIWAPERYSSKAYQPFLKAVTEIISKNDISLDDNGQCAIIGTHRIECENSRYIKKDVNTEKVIEVLSINQNSEGIDTEDRIQKAIATGFFSQTSETIKSKSPAIILWTDYVLTDYVLTD